MHAAEPREEPGTWRYDIVLRVLMHDPAIQRECKCRATACGMHASSKLKRRTRKE